MHVRNHLEVILGIEFDIGKVAQNFCSIFVLDCHANFQHVVCFVACVYIGCLR